MARVIPNTISERETNLIAEAAKSEQIKAAINLGFYQAMRVSEICNLEKQNIDTERGFIHIKQSKGHKDRDIPIMKPALYWLRFIPLKLTRQALHKAIKKLGREVLKKDIHPHTLRHSGASFYLNEKEIDVRHIQQLLGHSRLSTTEIYLHTNPEQLKKAYEKCWR